MSTSLLTLATALRYHPDRTTGSTEEFQKIQDAFDILGKAESKSKYDATLANGILNGTYLCPVCNDCPGRLDLDDIWAHINEVHRGARCTSCTSFSPETYKTLRTHLWNDHLWVLCTLCETTISKDSLVRHLWDYHRVDTCYKCDTTHDLFFSHLHDKHDLIGCPACEVPICNSWMKDHLTATHGYLNCPACVFDNAFDQEHLGRYHVMESCPVCKTRIQQDSLGSHLASRHAWIKCPDCDVYQSSCQMPEHKSGHTYINCPDCEEELTLERYNDHLRGRHGRKDCPLCEAGPLILADLRKHIQQNHRTTTACPVCAEPQTKDSLQSHLEQAHRWVRCEFCYDAFPGLKEMQDHEQLTHQIESCPECSAAVLATALAHHLIQRHQYSICAPSQTKSSRTAGDDGLLSQSDQDSASHSRPVRRSQIAGKKTRPYDRGRCPDCHGEYKFLTDHRRKRHGFHVERTLIERRVDCVKGNGITHSVSNVSRCEHCKKARSRGRTATTIK